MYGMRRRFCTGIELTMMSRLQLRGSLPIPKRFFLRDCSLSSMYTEFISDDTVSVSPYHQSIFP